ncbi:MAG: hypothetical protein SVO01_01395 [Thermotogota bacterium]|nr:hypothetical protein [Thermotogota bacterium]
MGMVLLCIEEGTSAPHDISDATGFDIKKVYNLLRKIRRKLDNYKPKLKR